MDRRGGAGGLAGADALDLAAVRSLHLKAGSGLRDGAQRIRHGRLDPRRGAPVLSTPGLDRLFAYGTIMTGFSRRLLLGPSATLEGRGHVRGSLYDFGEYPGVVLDDGGRVAGELYRVPDLAVRLAELDRAEWYDPADEAGSLYVRRRAPVRLDEGEAREAWIYVYNGLPGRGPRIASGDWRAHVTARGAAHR